jgi:hypothetical protein
MARKFARGFAPVTIVPAMLFHTCNAPVSSVAVVHPQPYALVNLPKLIGVAAGLVPQIAKSP